MVKKERSRKLCLKEARNAVKKLCAYLEKEQVPYKQVFLFGSHARGKQHTYSDIDAAVIVPNKMPAKIISKIKNFDLAQGARKISWRLEPHFFSEEDFENKYLSLPPEIKKYGIRIA